MHQLHFTINTCEYECNHEERISSIKSSVLEHFSETTSWDWFEVIGYVDLKKNTVHWNESADEPRFTKFLEKPDSIESWNEFLGGLIREDIIQQDQYPEYENTNLYYFKMQDYIKFLCSLRCLNSELVSGDVLAADVDYEKLPRTIDDYRGFYDYQFDRFGVTDFNCADDNAIIGLVDIHF